jgi:hypothetical protein
MNTEVMQTNTENSTSYADNEGEELVRSRGELAVRRAKIHVHTTRGSKINEIHSADLKN